MPEAIIQRLLELAKTPTCYEGDDQGDDQGDYGYNPGDNGNCEDAFSDGSEYGEILLAREILDNLGIDYK